MTRKDFELIAHTIADLRNVSPRGLLDCDLIAERFAGYLACTNPRFDRDRFLAACNAP